MKSLNKLQDESLQLIKDKNIKEKQEMSNRIYDISKWAVTVFLPALGALYAVLAGLWGFGYIEQVVGTVAAITAFGGALLGISSINYARKQ